MVASAWFKGAAIAALVMVGCGSGGSSPSTGDGTKSAARAEPTATAAALEDAPAAADASGCNVQLAPTLGPAQPQRSNTMLRSNLRSLSAALLSSDLQ